MTMEPEEVDPSDMALTQLASWLETHCQGSTKIFDAIQGRIDFLLLPLDTMLLLTWGSQLGTAILQKPEKVCAALVEHHIKKLLGGSPRAGPLSLHAPVLRFEFVTAPLPVQGVREAVVDMASHPPGLLLRVRGVVHWLSLPQKVIFSRTFLCQACDTETQWVWPQEVPKCCGGKTPPETLSKRSFLHSQELHIADKSRVGDSGFSQTIRAFLVSESPPQGLRVGCTCDVIGHTRTLQECTMQAHGPNDGPGMPCLQINSIVTAPIVPAVPDTPSARASCPAPWQLSPLSPAATPAPAANPCLLSPLSPAVAGPTGAPPPPPAALLETIPVLEKVTGSLCRLLCSFGAHLNAILPLFSAPSPPLLSLSLLLSIVSTSGEGSPTYRGTLRRVLGLAEGTAGAPGAHRRASSGAQAQRSGAGGGGCSLTQEFGGGQGGATSSSSSYWDTMWEGVPIVSTPGVHPGSRAGTPAGSTPGVAGQGRWGQKGVLSGRVGRGQPGVVGVQGVGGGGETELRSRSKLHVLMLMQEVPSFWLAAVGTAASLAQSSAGATFPRLRWPLLVGREVGGQVGRGAARQGATGGALTADSDAVTLLDIPCQGNMEETWKCLGEAICEDLCIDMRGVFGVDCSTVWCLVSFPRQRVGSRAQGYGDLQSVKGVGDRPLLCLANRFDCVVHLGPPGPNHPPHAHPREGMQGRASSSGMDRGGGSGRDGDTGAAYSDMGGAGPALGMFSEGARGTGGGVSTGAGSPHKGSRAGAREGVGGGEDEDLWAYLTGAVPTQEGGFQAGAQGGARGGTNGAHSSRPSGSLGYTGRRPPGVGPRGREALTSLTPLRKLEGGGHEGSPRVYRRTSTGQEGALGPAVRGQQEGEGEGEGEKGGEGGMQEGELRAYLAHASRHAWPGRVQEGAVGLMRQYYLFLVRSGLFQEEDTGNMAASILRLACSCAKLCLRDEVVAVPDVAVGILICEYNTLSKYGLFALPLSGHPSERLLAQGELEAALREFVPFLKSNVDPQDSME